MILQEAIESFFSTGDDNADAVQIDDDDSSDDPSDLSPSVKVDKTQQPNAKSRSTGRST